jgi:hypothetical protein
MDTTRDIQERLSTGPGIFALWYGVLAGPIAFMAQMQLKFMLVPWCCSIGSQWWLHLVTLVALVFPISSGLIAWRMWAAAGMNTDTKEGGEFGRTRAMGLAGVLVSAMFSLAMIAQDIPVFVLGACQ